MVVIFFASAFVGLSAYSAIHLGPLPSTPQLLLRSAHCVRGSGQGTQHAVALQTGPPLPGSAQPSRGGGLSSDTQQTPEEEGMKEDGGEDPIWSL